MSDVVICWDWVAPCLRCAGAVFPHVMQTLRPGHPSLLLL